MRSAAAARLRARLDALTRGSRARDATCVFLLGRAAPCDRLVSAAYFAVAAPVWAGYADSATHLAAFTAGLENCAPPHTVLDIGTGAGGSAAVVARRHPEAHVVGLNASAAMVRTARRLHALPNLEFRRGSSARLPFGDAAVDLVTLLNSVPELGELRRVCAPRAQVLVASTVFPLRPERSAWVGRWYDAGFTREAGGSVGDGSWEVYRPAG